jgi:hypothetical protein
MIYFEIGMKKSTVNIFRETCLRSLVFKSDWFHAQAAALLRILFPIDLLKKR